MKRISNPERSLIPPLLRSLPMPLYFNEYVVCSENIYEPLYSFATRSFATNHQRGGQWSFVSTSQANQTFAVLSKIGQLCGAFLLCGLAHLEARNELTEILVSQPRLA